MITHLYIEMEFVTEREKNVILYTRNVHVLCHSKSNSYIISGKCELNVDDLV